MTDTAPEFSRPIAVGRLAPGETVLEIDASPAECVALAQRFFIRSVGSLKAQLRLHPLGGELVRVSGKLQAEVTQDCVVSLVPVPASIEESFNLIYGPEDEAALSTEIVVGEEDDPPEPIIGGVIDVGEAVAEHLALALDPFPRAAGAEIPDEYADDEGVAEAITRDNPFAALDALRKNKE